VTVHVVGGGGDCGDDDDENFLFLILQFHWSLFFDHNDDGKSRSIFEVKGDRS
jgi:hypothetical protein